MLHFENRLPEKVKKEESDKIFEEKVAQDQKERAEKLASKYKPGKCFQTLGRHIN